MRVQFSSALWGRHCVNPRHVLPFLDGIFAVAFTLMSTSVPDMLPNGHEGVRELLIAMLCYLLSGVAVLLYWFKLRRLVGMAAELRFVQLVIGFFSLLTIVALPKMASLAIRFGQGQGDFFHWTPSQVANVAFLGALFLFDLLVLLLALSLRGNIRPGANPWGLDSAIAVQSLGFLVLIILGLMELAFSWFNSEYVLLVPIVLLLEEMMVLRFFSLGL